MEKEGNNQVDENGSDYISNAGDIANSDGNSDSENKIMKTMIQTMMVIKMTMIVKKYKC